MKNKLIKIYLLIFILAIGPSSGVFCEDAQENLPKEEGRLQSINQALQRVENPQWPTDIPENEPSVSPESAMIDQIDVQNMDIHEVLKIISAKGNLPIWIEDPIEGKVTIYLKNVPALEALRIVLDTQSLAYSEEKGIFYIMTADEYKKRFALPFGQNIQTKIIPLTYAKVSDIEPLLEQMKGDKGRVIVHEENNTFILIDSPEKLEAMSKLIAELDARVETKTFELKHIPVNEMEGHIREVLTPNVGRIERDESTNKLAITDRLPKINEIEKMIKSLDEEEKEMTLDVRVLQIVLNDEHEQGVDWQAIVSHYSPVVFEAFGKSTPGPSQSRMTLGTLSKDDYQVLLDALDTVGEIYPVLDISMKTSLNKEMELPIHPFLARKGVKARYVADPSQALSNEMILFCVLKKVADNLFSLYFKDKPFLLTEKGSFIDSEEFSKAVNVNVSQDTTIVLGGLFKEVKEQFSRKIPLLGDLPILGFVFRNEHERIRKSELVVFITPKDPAKEQ